MGGRRRVLFFFFGLLRSEKFRGKKKKSLCGRKKNRWPCGWIRYCEYSCCRHIDLRNRSAGERFPEARNRSKRICTSSYLVGLAFCPRRELPVLLTLYLDKNHHQHQDRTVRTN